MRVAFFGTTTLLFDDGREIRDANKTGEIVYKGPNVTLGYAERSADLARGVAALVSMPRGAQITELEIQPEAPIEEDYS